jgi:hypothetical protein
VFGVSPNTFPIKPRPHYCLNRSSAAINTGNSPSASICVHLRANAFSSFLVQLEPGLYGILRLFLPFHRKCLSMNNLQLFPRFSNQAQSSLIKPNRAIFPCPHMTSDPKTAKFRNWQPPRPVRSDRSDQSDRSGNPQSAIRNPQFPDPPYNQKMFLLCQKTWSDRSRGAIMVKPCSNH